MAKKNVPNYIKKEIKSFIESLQSEGIPINEVYLFGSYAKGLQKKDSDIDVCVISPKFSNGLLATQYLWHMRPKNYIHTIEPVGFHPRDFRAGDTALIDEIKRTGVQIL
ncbi:MAG: nucleotidyltransferase domain-containing protein [Candidatus Magasanikbacteria bacterium]|nr:nucleotidyltransferase domain-containing protein [Candidatus Magasanikbacteria bacterium]